MPTMEFTNIRTIMDRGNMFAFLNMMQSVDAFFPIGAFTLSNGLETYVQQDVFRSVKDLEAYLEDYGSLFPENDLGIMALAWKCGTDKQKIKELDQWTGAAKPAKEIREGSHKTGIRFLKAEERMRRQEENALKVYRELVNEKQAYGYHSIALGLYARDLKLNLHTALGMYAYSVLSAVVNNAVKLVPLSQMEGQRVLNEQLEKIDEMVGKAENIKLEMLGVSGASYDIRCMQHEWLYTRLYMS